MNKSESKYFNTARLMDEALLLLLEKKDYAYITVKEVCAKAGVNRSTFYLHYETMDDLLNESLALISSRLFEKYGDVDVDVIHTGNELFLLTPQYIAPFLEFMKENQRLFRAAISKPTFFRSDSTFDFVYKTISKPILERLHVDEREHKYVLSFFENGIYAIVTEWIRSGCKEDMEYISQLLIKYTSRFGDEITEVRP